MSWDNIDNLMKNRIELIYDDKNSREVKEEIGYMRLLIAILGSRCHIIIHKHYKKHHKPKI